MRHELNRLIENARVRLGEQALSPVEAEEEERQKAIDAFKGLLARNLETSTRIEILLGAEYLWEHDAPAVRFSIDEHNFMISGGKSECLLTEQFGDRHFEVARLAASDPLFEARLLSAIGSSLDPVRQ